MIAFLLGLLAVNLLISFLTSGAPNRPRVPYQPFFVNQVNAKNVEEISSKGESIEGQLKNEATYDPPGDDKPFKVTKFKTEVPSFLDPAQITTLLANGGVTVNAEPPDSGRSLLGTLLLGFLPWLLLIGFFIWLAENISTFYGVWRYPNQLGAWSAVHVGKWSSWSLLVIMTFTIVANLKHIKERIHVPA